MLDGLVVVPLVGGVPVETGIEMGGRLHGKRVDDELLFLCRAHVAVRRLIEE